MTHPTMHDQISNLQALAKSRDMDRRTRPTTLRTQIYPHPPNS